MPSPSNQIVCWKLRHRTAFVVVLLNGLRFYSNAQEESPTLQPNVGTVVDRLGPAIQPRDNGVGLGPFDVLVSLRGSAFYDDNIYIQRADETSDLVWTLTPSLTLATGNYHVRKGSFVTLAYSPSVILFTDHSANNSFDQDATAEFEWHSARWTVGLKQTYQKLSGSVIEVGNRATRSIYNTGLAIKYDLSPKTALELEAEQSINDYDAPLLSYNQWTVAAWLDYWFAPKVKLGVGVTAGWIDVRQSFNQTYQQILVRAGYFPTEKIEVRASVGLERRELETVQDDRFNGVFSLGVTYRPTERTQVLVDGYRRDHSSLTLANQNYTVTGFSVGVRQSVSARYALTLAGGYDHSEYYATGAGALVGREFNYFFAQVGVDYEIDEQLTIGVVYQLRQNTSTSAANDFRNNRVGLTARYHF